MKLTTDIFLITYPHDHPWLLFLFRSIARNVTGYRRLVVVVEEHDSQLPVVDALRLAGIESYEICRCRQYRGSPDCNGMTGQQIEKLRAWSYTNADRVVFVDSDHVYFKKVDLSGDSPNVRLDKPYVIYSPWHKVPEHWVETPEGPKSASPRKWFEPTREVLGFVPPVEAMRKPPFVYPGWFLHKLWEFVGGEERLKTFEHPNEFNCMGNYAMVEYPEHFTFMEQCDPAMPEHIVHNFWSHNGVDHPLVRAELERFGLDK
jgi:hypothetical protein